MYYYVYKKNVHWTNILSISLSPYFQSLRIIILITQKCKTTYLSMWYVNND